MNLENFNLAEIVVDLQCVTKRDINFINQSGVIIYSTNVERVNTVHEIAKQVCQNNKTIEIYESDVSLGIQKGINSPIIINDQVIGCIGITGDPDEVREYQQITKKLTECYMRSQMYTQELLSNTKFSNKIIDLMINNGDLRIYAKQIKLRNLIVEEGLYPLIITNMEEEAGNEFIIKWKKHLIATIDNKMLIAIGDEKIVTHLLAIIDKTDYKLIVGEKTLKLKELNHSYASVQESMNLLKIKQVINLNKLNLDRVIISQNKEHYDYYKHHIINQLKDIGYYCTLFNTYFENNRSIKKVAAKLYMNESTVKYQLKKLETMLGLELTMSNCINIYIAFKLWKLRN